MEYLAHENIQSMIEILLIIQRGLTSDSLVSHILAVNQLRDKTEKNSILNPKVAFIADYVPDGFPEHNGLPDTEPHTLTD